MGSTTSMPGLVELMYTLAKGRMQMAIHMCLHAIMAEHAIDRGRRGAINLLPGGYSWVQHSAEGVVPICEKHRGTPM